MKIKNFVISLSVIVCFMSACDRNVYFSDHQSVNAEGWNMNSDVFFNVDVDNTHSPFNFFVELRNTQDYPYDKTFLFIKTLFPDGGVALDTMECPLADVDGRWYGKVSGKYVDNRYFLRRNVRFPQKGLYQFRISQATRDTNLIGIKDVGLRIEYVE